MMDNQAYRGRIDTVSKVIAALPRTLYQAFMDPSSLVQWLPPQGMRGEIGLFEPQVKGRYRLTLTYGEQHTTAGKTTKDSDVSEGIFTELIPDKKIATAGAFQSEEPDFAGNMVMIWYFEEVTEGTKVTIIAENVPEGIKKEDHIDGLNSTLENLKRFVETE